VSRISEAARARLAEAMRARRADPAFVAKLAAERATRQAWAPEQIETARRMAADGATAGAIGRALKVDENTARARCLAAGIDLGVAARRMEAGAAVLRQHYATTIHPDDLLALYGAARETVVTRKMLNAHAKSMGLRRPAEVRLWNLGKHRQDVSVARAARMAALAARVQRHIDAGMVLRDAARAEHVGNRVVTELRASGAVRLRARAAAPKPAPDAEAHRMAADAARERRRQARERDRAIIPAAAPRAFQTVEEFLAGGGRITRCPAAYVAPSEGGSVSAEDAARLRAHAQAAAAEMAKHGNNGWKAARAALGKRRAAAERRASA
jgi:hypothetical protein